MQTDPERVIPMLKKNPLSEGFPPTPGWWFSFKISTPRGENNNVNVKKKIVPQYKRLKWKECYIEQ